MLLMNGEPPLERDFSFEILKTERVRTFLLMCVLAGLFVATIIMGFVVPRPWNPIYRLVGERFPFLATAVFYGFAFLYELGVYSAVGRAIQRGIRVPAWARYGNAFAETSMPTIMLILLARALGPEIALNSPLPMVYFLFISLSTLRLARPLSIFTGCVAGGEFAGVAFYYLGRSGSETFMNSPSPMVARALLMAVAGVVCGFVGVQTRRRITALLASLAERHRVVNMFGQYVSPAVVDQLLHQPLDGAAQVQHVTIMFVDIRNFTTFAEHRQPNEVMDYLNTLFRELIALITSNHGIINKFLGDGFMACFGAPLSNGSDTKNAVKAAIAIAKTVERLNADGVIPPTRIGIGLHAGAAMTGSVGSDERKEYTIIGDTVNLASRVEQLTKQYGSILLVTDPVWQAVKDVYPARALDSVAVKGRSDPVAIYALL